ncbi:hypothetical protein FRX31_024178 [Thalictrum thalictroides]|uniref:Uncharacterized protein n=1 Tax=Thalictrum thalictroides TaxID=46969 RepID=A0A7J6VMU0_THATH|nr:hypothetical protein FRX31_024178 [Thalictrum thalictroides]
MSPSPLLLPFNQNNFCFTGFQNSIIARKCRHNHRLTTHYFPSKKPFNTKSFFLLPCHLILPHNFIWCKVQYKVEVDDLIAYISGKSNQELSLNNVCDGNGGLTEWQAIHIL